MPKISWQTSTYLLRHSLTQRRIKTELSRKAKLENLKMFPFAK